MFFQTQGEETALSGSHEWGKKAKVYVSSFGGVMFNVIRFAETVAGEMREILLRRSEDAFQ